MIVDLVRNDMSRIATKGSVQVEELCKVYPSVHGRAMISTVVAELHTETSVTDHSCLFSNEHDGREKYERCAYRTEKQRGQTAEL